MTPEHSPRKATSGTTGVPKLVPLRRSGLLHVAAGVEHLFALTEADRALNSLPLFHIHGLSIGLVAPLVAGGAVLLPEGRGGAEALDLAVQRGASWATGVPTFHHDLVMAAQARPDLAAACRLRFIRSASSPLPAPVRVGLELAFGVPVLEGYGMTEACSFITQQGPFAPTRHGELGAAQGLDLVIDGADGRTTAPGVVGEVLIRGPAVISGYFEGALPTAFTEDWLRTGDVGELDAAGNLRLVARLSEFINSGGIKVEGQPEVTAEKFRNFSPDRLGLPSGPSLRLYRTGDRARWRSDGSAIDYLGRLDAQVKLNGYRIEPGEIEATMLLAADIRKAVVIPVADGAGGAVTGLTAFFETTTPPVQSGLAESNLRIALSHKLPRFLMPTRFVHMSQGLPLTANGKVDRRALLAAARATSKQSAAPLSGIEPALADLWTELLGQPIVTADADFFLLGGHSLLAIRMLARVEKQFGRLIEVSRFLADARLSKLQEMLWTRAAPASGGLLAPETSRHLVLLRAGDPALAPIICLPGVMGMPVWSHFLLANLTPTGQPMLGLKVDFSEHEDALPQTLQQLAEIFADVICDQWADSECGVTLLGYSIGGFIAAAVASVLEGRNCPPAKVILIDPNTNLAPNPQTPPQQQGAFPRNWLERLRIHHRLQPLKTPMDYIFCTQGFPMPRAEDAEEWAVFAQGGVRVRRLDAFHLSIVQRPWAGMLAECVSDILNDTEMPEKVTTAPWDSARIQLAQEAAEAVYDRRLPDALTNLDQIAARIRPEPDFLFIQRVRLMAATGARMRLASAALRRILSPQPFRPALWGPLVAVLDRVGMARIGDLAVWRGMHGAGGLRGCGFLGVYRLVQRRKFKAAASLLARFEYTPGLEIETLLAQAIMARRGGQQGTAYSLIAKALARSDAGLPHFDTAIRQILDRSDRAFILDLLAAASDLFRDDPVVLTLRKAWEQYIADPAMPEPWLDDDLAPQQQA